MDNIVNNLKASFIEQINQSVLTPDMKEKVRRQLNLIQSKRNKRFKSNNGEQQISLRQQQQQEMPPPLLFQQTTSQMLQSPVFPLIPLPALREEIKTIVDSMMKKPDEKVRKNINPHSIISLKQIRTLEEIKKLKAENKEIKALVESVIKNNYEEKAENKEIKALVENVIGMPDAENIANIRSLVSVGEEINTLKEEVKELKASIDNIRSRARISDQISEDIKQIKILVESMRNNQQEITQREITQP